jgi:hypothetical protein
LANRRVGCLAGHVPYAAIDLEGRLENERILGTKWVKKVTTPDGKEGRECQWVEQVTTGGEGEKKLLEGLRSGKGDDDKAGGKGGLADAECRDMNREWLVKRNETWDRWSGE